MVQGFGALDSMRTMVGVLREVSLDEIREQAETLPRLLIVAPTAEEARSLGLEVTGPEGESGTVVRAVDERRSARPRSRPTPTTIPGAARDPSGAGRAGRRCAPARRLA